MNTTKVRLLDLVSGVSAALDLVSPTVAGHHRRVTYTAARMGLFLGVSADDLMSLMLAALMHDAGALSLKSRLDALTFETDSVEHAEIGYKLLKGIPYLERSAEIVRHHHTGWSCRKDDDCFFLANILNTADRADVLIDRALGATQASHVASRLSADKDRRFCPLSTEAFAELATDRTYWDDLTREGVEGILRERSLSFADIENPCLGMHELVAFSELFSRIIDFRSRFTATHSKGVAATAEFLAQESGFDETGCLLMRVAGNLHDLGKLAVPSALIEKPAALTDGEMDVVRGHAVVTGDILSSIEGMETVCEWASSHHEMLDGSGYPGGHAAGDISEGSRILAVADIFTAITEDRPYRSGMPEDQALGVLTGMAKQGKLDPEVVFLLKKKYDLLNAIRIDAQATAKIEFERQYA